MKTTNYDDLIDAEREALSRGGRDVGKIGLIKAVREATGLGLKDAKDVVEDYLARRSAGPLEGRGEGWIDGLLDAERAAAGREDRAITRITLIRAVREASGLGLKPARDAVEDYLRRRGGEGLKSGRGGIVLGFSVVLAIMVIGGAIGWFWN